MSILCRPAAIGDVCAARKNEEEQSMKTIASLVMILVLALLLALPAQAQDGGRTFPETGFSLKGDFLSFWDRNGGLAVFGFPLTYELGLPNKDLGRVFTVQYVERQRFELHPENRGT